MGAVVQAAVPNLAERRRDIRTRMDHAVISSWREIADDGLAVFTIRRPDGAPFFRFQPGQYAMLAFADQSPDDPRPRAYSIASTPDDPSTLEFLVVLVSNERPEGGVSQGVFTGALWRHAVGDEVLFLGPAGRFTLDRTTQRDVVCVATGTGLAPFISMARTLHADYQRTGRIGRRLTLIHGVSYARYLAYRDELTELAIDRGFDLLYVPVISRPDRDDRYEPWMGTGRANDTIRLLLGNPKAGLVDPTVPPSTRARLLQRLNPATSALYLCGHPGMIQDVKSVASAAGFVDGGRSRQILTEDYW